jgi:hypothetical protein
VKNGVSSGVPSLKEIAMAPKVLLLVSLTVFILPPGTLAAPVPKVGDKVWAQWNPNQEWYRGKATKTCAIGLHIVFSNDEKADLPLALMALDSAPKKDEVAVGTRVLAFFTDDKFYPGTVMKMGEDNYDIQYDNGDTHTVTLDDLRLIAVKPTAETTAKKGDEVWAQWQPNQWYKGKAASTCAVGLHVVFDDGDEADLPVPLIAIDRAPKKDQVKVGTRVLARWKAKRFFPGTVTKISNNAYSVGFDDSTTHTVALDDLRLLNQ